MRTETIINPDTGELIPSYPGTPNELILQDRQANLDRTAGPKVGDFIRMENGQLHRFCIDHGINGLQTTPGGSFYLGAKGCDYSGGCDPSMNLYRIRTTGQRKEGSVWFFDNDQWGAGRGVQARAMFNVWEFTPDNELTAKQRKQCARYNTGRIRGTIEYWGIDDPFGWQEIRRAI